MPNYSSLRLSTGGGLISENHLAKQREDTATIVIGCGGTGKDALKQLKKSMIARVCPDDPKAPVPKFEHVKFLSIDSDPRNLKQSDVQSKSAKDAPAKKSEFVSSVADLDKATEFFPISNEDIVNRIQRLAENEKKGIGNPGYEWFNASGKNNTSPVTMRDATAGAGGVRQIGRLLLVDKIKELKERIDDLVTQAKEELDEPKVQVLIFAGIGGGTGSGTFLDVCYLVKYVMQNAAIDKYTIQAMVFLPDVNLCKVSNPSTKSFIQSNGYYALRELDYCMNLDQSKNFWRLELGGAEHFDYNLKPADIVNIISAQTFGASTFKDGYGYAMNVAADYAIDLICEADGFNFDSHRSNCGKEVKKVAGKQKYGANYDYCILGGAAVEVPFRKIMTYLASAVYSTEFNDVKNNKPTLEEFDDFKKKIGLGDGIGSNEPPIFKAMCQREERVPYVAPDYNEYKDDFNNGSNAPLIQEIDATLATRHGYWVENKKNLLGMLEDYSTQHSSEALSIINKIYHELLTIMRDPERGPFYARELLTGGHGKSLLNAIDGHRAWADEKYGISMKNYSHNEKHYLQPAERKFFEKARRFGSKGRYEEYAKYCIAHYNYLDDIGHNENGKNYQGRIAIFKDMLNDMKDQITALSNELTVLCGMLTELEDVFNSNYTALKEGVEFDFVDGTYIKELFKINDPIIRKGLDESVEVVSKKQMFYELMGWLLDHHDIWSEDNEVLLGISSIFKKEFDAYANKSLERYLMEHFGLVGKPKELADVLEKEFYPSILKKAKPLFWKSPVFDMATVGRFGYVSAPINCAAIVTAATNVVANTLPGYYVRKSAQEDRIQIQVFASGVPMYAYNGQDLYKTEAFKELGKGHGNSSHEGDEDWSVILPFITPATVLRIKDSDSYDVKHAQDRYAVFQKGMDYNILTAGPFDGTVNANTNLFLHFIDYDALNSEIEAIRNALVNNEITAEDAVDKAKEISARLEKQKDHGDDASFVLPKIDVKYLETTCLAGSEKEVRFDNFVRVRGFNEEAEQEIAKFEQLVKMVEDFCDETLSMKEREDSLTVFTRALFAGLIKVNDEMYHRYSFTPIYDDIEDEEVELSEPLMRFANIGIYQAFLIFAEQPAKLIKNAKERADAIYANDHNTLRASLKQIGKTILSDATVKQYTITRNASRWTETEKTEIQKFVNDMVKQFKFEYGLYVKNDEPVPDGWTCEACGTAGNTGKRCMECGNPRPVADGSWSCSCGQTVNKGKFCIECGKPRPVDDGSWTCSCGQTGNKGKFCIECGSPRS